MRRTNCVAWSAMFAVTSACGAAVPAVPGRGGPTWTELTSEHFTMWTDAERERGRELVQQMEQLRQVVVGVAFPSLPAEGRTQVFALRDDDELAAFSVTGEARALASTPGLPLWQPMIVMSTRDNIEASDRTVAHELTHVISSAVVHHQPRWFSEGMAEFFQTVRLDPERGTADVGVAPSIRGQPMHMAHLIPIETLFAWQNIGKHEEREYSTAWALFTYLINTHRGELVHYLQLLHVAGKPRNRMTVADQQALWREAFPSLPLGDVDSEIRRWLIAGSHTVMHFTVQFHPWSVAERVLADADVYAMRATLRALVTDQSTQARADAAAALAVDPANVMARLVAAALDHAEITADQARAMAAAHREDWRAWWIAATVLSETQADAGEVASARTSACTLFARNPALFAPSDLCANAPVGASR